MAQHTETDIPKPETTTKQKPSQLMDMLNIKQGLLHMTKKDWIECIILVLILLGLSAIEYATRIDYMVISILAARISDILIGWICANTAITWRDKYKSDKTGQTNG